MAESLESRRLFAAPAAVQFGLTDATFGTSGHAYVSGHSVTGMNQTVVSSSGKIYVEGGNYGELIARFTAAGKLDSTFGTRGLASAAGGTFAAEAVDASDRLYVVVTVQNGNSKQTVLIRYTAAGTVDSTYATGGSTIVTTDSLFTPTSLTLQSDGKVVVVGTQTTSDGHGREARVFRVAADGSADTSFGSGGSVQNYLGTATALAPTIYDVVNGVRVLGSGDIEIGGGSIAFSSGSNQTFTESSYALERLTASGAADSSFNTGGIVRYTYLTNAQVNDSAGFGSLADALPKSFDALPDGSAVMAGTQSLNYTANLSVARFSRSGGLIYRIAVPADPLSDTLYSKVGVVALADGRAVLLGNASSWETGFALTNIAADGTVGTTVLTDDLNSSTTDMYGEWTPSLAVSASGQLLVAGASTDYQTLVLQQLNASTASAPRPDDIANAGANSVAGADNGFLYVSYYNTTTRTLMFDRRLRNGIWDKPITIDSRVGAGQYVAVQSDAANQPVIVYYDAKSKTLKSATSTNFGKTFSVAQLDAVPGVGQYVVGTSGYTSGGVVTQNEYFAYRDATHGSLKLATYNAARKWSITTVDGSKENVGQDIAITTTTETIDFNATNRVMIAYYDATAGAVKYAGQTASGFAIKTVAMAAKGIEGLSIRATNHDKPAIAFHDLGTGDVRLSVYTTGPKFVTHTIATHTGQATALSASLQYDDPDVLVYNKSANRLSDIQDPLGERITTTVQSGGAYLNAPTQIILAQVIALVDLTTGTLEIRPLLTS